jgi:HlyD family secretion protein
MNLKKNEYDQVSKQSEIDRLQNATKNIEVRSDIEGIIQKIDTSQMGSSSDDGVQDTLDDSGSSSYYGSDSDDNAFITILSTGEYRVKGTVNELNINSLSEGQSILIRSRADETQVWYGTIGSIDRENPTSSNSSNSWYSSSSDSDTNSSSYPFYVELDSSDGLMLGQHVYIEPDNGQETVKSGIWLNESYIVDVDTSDPYVWAANAKNRLEKRSVVLGQYDEALGEYEILSGLEKEDMIAFPESSLEEGLPTTTDISALLSTDEDVYEDDVLDMDSYDGADYDMDYDEDWEDWEDEDSYEEYETYEIEDDGEIIEDDFSDSYEDFGDYDEDTMIEDDGYEGGAEVYEDLPEVGNDDGSSDSLEPVTMDDMEDLG